MAACFQSNFGTLVSGHVLGFSQRSSRRVHWGSRLVLVLQSTRFQSHVKVSDERPRWCLVWTPAEICLQNCLNLLTKFCLWVEFIWLFLPSSWVTSHFCLILSSSLPAVACCFHPVLIKICVILSAVSSFLLICGVRTLSFFLIHI